MKLSQRSPIADLEELQTHLQFAIGLELATIPVYLSALYSIRAGENTAATRVIQSVVIEEMLHMALAANVLNAIGGEPSANPVPGVGDPIPHFPAKIPFLPSMGELHLRRFSGEALRTFLEIEHPETHNEVPPSGYGSIGAFYTAIARGIEDFCSEGVFEQARIDRAGCQMRPEEFYGGAGRLTPVTNKQEALAAIRQIVDQGEGISATVLEGLAKDHGVRPGYLPTVENDTMGRQPEISVDDGDVLADGWKMYSHYARFKEINVGRRFHLDQTIGEDPTGDVLPVNWDDVYKMATDPSAEQYSGTEIAASVDAFNATYTRLLNAIYASFNGEAGKIREAVTLMWSLKYEAVALMKTPSPLPGQEGLTVGAPFEYKRCPSPLA